MKQIHRFIYSILLILFFSISMNGYGQANKLQESYSWNFKTTEKVKLNFNNYNCDLLIHTSESQEIKYIMTVNAVLKDAEDKERLHNYLSNTEFKHSPSSVQINNRFWESMKNVLGKKTMEIKGEKSFRYSDFKMKGELWIPAGCQLSLNSKYSIIEMENFEGDLKLNLYNDKVYANNVSGTSQIKAKYSNLEFRNMDDIHADFYNTDLLAGSIGNLTLLSKYSKFKADKAGDIVINGYNDKHYFGNTGNINYNDKYSNLTASEVGNMSLDCYTSNIIVESAKLVNAKTKYGSFEAKKISTLRVISNYNTSYTTEKLGKLNITESKYGDYKIGELMKSVTMTEGYTDKINILRSDQDLERVQLNGKNTNIQLSLDPDFQYRLKAKVVYPKFDIDEENMDIRKKIVQSSNYELEAVKGSEEEKMPVLEFKGYNISLTLSENDQN